MEKLFESPSKKRKINVSQKSLQYFDYLDNIEGRESYKCKTCEIVVNGSKKWNLASHLKCHQSVYKELTMAEKTIEYERLKLLLNCVHFVTVNGRPFKALNDSAIIKMNEEKLEELRVNGMEVNLRDPHLPEVKRLLINIAENMRKKIGVEVANRHISLMVDIVSKHGRSFLGASIQYIIDGILIIRSIGMIDLKESHTGIYLAELIIKRLNVLGINLTQVISITTDNGKNVLKMVRDLEKRLQKSVDDAKTDQNQLPVTPSKSKKQNAFDENDDDIDREIEDVLGEPDISDDVALELLFSEYDDQTLEPTEIELNTNQNILKAISSSLSSNHDLNVIWDITNINCSAHTLQLVTNDGIAAMERTHVNVIKLSRRVAKFLRKESTINSMKQSMNAYKKPRIDVETRWCSTYLMVRYS